MVSLATASQIAYSGLATAQARISVTSANISNSDTDGYTAKKATAVAVQSGLGGSGTAIGSITSSVDKYVLANLVEADSNLGAAKTTASYTDQLQTLLGSTSGTTDGGTSIAASMSSLESAVTTLAASPDSDTDKAQVITALSNIAGQVRSLGHSIQSERGNADQEIGTNVDAVNQSLSTIDDLNKSIVQTRALGQSSADLEDKRTTALRDVAAKMDVSYYTTSAGSMVVTSKGGSVLVDSTVHKLSYTPASAVSATTTFDSIKVDGKDISSEITSGSIKALTDMRDTTLVNAATSLDTFTSTLKDKINAATADGSAVPAPTSLTGTVSTTSSDSLSASGTLRVALVDSSGKLVSSSDLDLSSYSCVGDVGDALNSVSGVSASINSDGHLAITSTTSGDGVAIGTVDGATTSVGSGSQSFSTYFGLNSVLTGTSAIDLAVPDSLTTNSGLFPSGTLSSSATASDGDTVLTSGSTTVAQALQTALTTSYSFDASGGLGAQTSTLTNYAAAIVGHISTVATNAKSNETTVSAVQSSLNSTLTSQSGVNIDEETANLADYQKVYSASAQVMSTVNTMFQSMLTVVENATS